jgi:hypothetical protein
MTTDANGHPSLDGSLLVALALWRQLSGRERLRALADDPR